MNVGQEMYKALISEISNFEKLARAYNITFFHGTSCSFLDGIYDKGLLPTKPVPYQPKAVFLTNNIQKAAHYAFGFEDPCVLEINISSSKRLNKVFEDNLDKDTDKYDSDEIYNLLDEDIRKIEYDCRDILKNIGLPQYRFRIDKDNILKTNIFKEIINFIRSNDLDLQSKNNLIYLAKSKFHLLQNYEFVEIAQDGTIVPMDNFYESLHQAYYENKIPVSAIKFVWIPANLVKDEVKQKSLEIKHFGTQVLPSDLGNFNALIQSWQSKTYKLNDSNFEDYKKRIIDDLDDFNKIGLGSDFVNDISNCSSKEELEDMLLDFDLEQINDIIRVQDWLKFNIGLKEVKNIIKD